MIEQSTETSSGIASHFLHLIETSPLFIVGSLLLVGYIFGIIAHKIKIPAITGYIVAGLLLGESGFNIVPHDTNSGLSIITQIVLGLIAFTIGGEFSITKLKRMGSSVVVMTFTQIGLTFGLVTFSLFLFKLDLPFSLLMGAIATATAPAATVAIVQALKLRGKFVDYLYGLVALDDAGCIIVFGAAAGVATGMLGGVAGSMGILLFRAMTELIISILIGIVFAFIIHSMTKKIKSNPAILIIILSLLAIETAIANVFHLSSLLANMAMGATIINISPRNHRLFNTVEPFTPPIYALFFIIAGIELNLHILFQKETLILGLLFVLARALGKYFGIYGGAILCKAPLGIRNNMGFCMLPQAGVSLGLALFLRDSPVFSTIPAMQEMQGTLINIVLFAVLVNELCGPVISGIAIKRGIKAEQNDINNHNKGDS